MSDKQEVDSEECTHGVQWPGDDEYLRMNLSSEQTRILYPRFQGTCPLCGYVGIYYASWMQYMGGDY